MSWDNNDPRRGTDPGQGQGFDPRQGFVVPPMPTAPPPAPADGLRAAAVALLNLCGLGLGYALVRRWWPAAACWAATAVLLLVALPADPDGVGGGVPATYLVLLALAAVHGAVVGLRTRLTWPPAAWIAVVLGIVLLAVPAGGVVLYGDARDEATEQMLLDRLDRADELVRAAGRQPFPTAESDYRQALTAYRDLRGEHPGSRAADRVPGRLKSFYTTVASPYDERNYCDAVAPLKYLRTVPRTMGENEVGALRTWPDDRLATSLYECGAQSLSGRVADWTTHFGQLLSTFPQSEQAAEVAPSVKAAVDRAVKDVGGDEPCKAVERLDTLNTQVSAVRGDNAEVTAALDKDAARARKNADSGAYACGVDQYREKSFAEAVTTMNDFAKSNPHHRNQARAKKIAIAAEVAQTVPAAGRRLPTTASGGSISVTVKNDSPDDITVLYTGPVTGSFTLKACGKCTSYSLTSTVTAGFEPCSDSGRNYPQRTISLPAGTTYFVHKSRSGTGKSPASDTAELSSGYIYTECAYTTSFGY